MTRLDHVVTRARARTTLALTAVLLVAASVAQAQRGATPDYIIGPNDVLSVYVWNHPEISTQVSVSQSGNVSYPLIGEVQVGGITVRDAEERIRKSLEKYYVDPKVTVTLTGLVGKRISVTGEVVKPGEFDYIDGFTLSQYIAGAGGVREAANMKNARITRLSASGAKVITIDMNRVVHDGRRDLDLILEPGDTVTIPRKWFYSFRDYSTVAGLLLTAVTVWSVLELRSRR